MTLAISPQFGTLQEAAEILGVTPATVRRYIDRGLVQAERVGPRLIRVNLNALSIGTPISGAHE